jgi:hypothetical protein
MSDSLVAGWLTELNLMECIKTFRDEGIDSEALTGLDDAQLKVDHINQVFHLQPSKFKSGPSFDRSSA